MELEIWLNGELGRMSGEDDLRGLLKKVEKWHFNPTTQYNLVFSGLTRKSKARNPYFKIWSHGKGFRLSKPMVAKFREAILLSLDGGNGEFCVGIQNASSAMGIVVSNKK